MSLSDLLEMHDEEVFELKYWLLKKQATLYRIISDMMDQLERVQVHKEEMELKLERLKIENASLRKSIKDISK